MYIGLDIGTSGTKAELIDGVGKVIDAHQISYSFCNTENGYRELDATAVWNAVLTCLMKAGQKRPVKTITVSALGEAIVLIDQNGLPMAPSITGTDARGADELKEMIHILGEEALMDITGLNLSTIYSVNKILWLKKHNRRIYEGAWKIVTFQDYIIFRLTGTAAIDYSMASRTMMFDISKNDWSEEILQKAGIDRTKLSRPCRAGTVVGTAAPSIAQEMGLGPNIRIVAGTHDHICNAIGAGAADYGECVNTVGTTEGLTALIKRPQLYTDGIKAFQISCEPFVRPDMFNTVAWNHTSGVLLKWFAREFAENKYGNTDLMEIYRRLNGEMKPLPTDLLVLPHFSGAATPHMDENAKGVILGLTLNTHSSDIYKALMEGANYELALILDCLKQSGLEPKKLIAAGGALSDKLLQIKADILGCEIYTTGSRQTGTLGGAILGAVASNDFTDISEAVHKMVKKADVYEPDSVNHRRYKERFMIYRDLYERTRPICHRLSKVKE